MNLSNQDSDAHFSVLSEISLPENEETVLSTEEVVQDRSAHSLEALYKIRSENPSNILISYININSIRNKMQNLSTLLQNKVDILAIAETKLDESFPTSQFMLEGYAKPYRLDINRHSGGLLVYVNENIPSCIKKDFNIDSDLQIIPFELNLRKQKWIVFSIYRPPKKCLKDFLSKLSTIIDFYTRNYVNILVMGDFNAEPHNSNLKMFMDKYDLYNHIKEKTCWKSSSGSCIDLVMSNKKFSFKHSGAAETGLSDHHLLVYTMLKTTFTKLGPRKYTYRNYKNYDVDKFLRELDITLRTFENLNYEIFQEVLISLLNQFAPLKTRYLRANNKPHVTKTLRKAIMKRSRLKNIANKTKNPKDQANYRTQRNLVCNMNKKAREFFLNRNDPSLQCKTFWKACKPYFSDKGSDSRGKILLLENENILTNDYDIATVFNKFFSNITGSLAIPRWNLGFSSSSNDPVTCAIEKFKDHPSILSIEGRFETENAFEFSHVTVEEVYEEITRLDSSKKTSGDIPIKVLKDVATVSAPALTHCFNVGVDSSIFPDELKIADVVPVHKKDATTDKLNYRPISLLTTISKVFERLVHKQLLCFMQSKLSRYLCGFRKGYSTQYALLNLVHDWQKSLSKSEKSGRY